MSEARRRVLSLLAPTRAEQIDLALKILQDAVARARAGDRGSFDALFPGGCSGPDYERTRALCAERRRWDLLRQVAALLGSPWPDSAA